MSWNGIERNKLDYILSDLLPVEVSELFSFTQFYYYLLDRNNQKILSNLTEKIKKIRFKGDSKLFVSGWCTKPLKYKILKDSDSKRVMSILQPLSALNVFLFIECYQKDILNYFDANRTFSIRYHRKSTNLFYKKNIGRTIQYFQGNSRHSKKDIIQQTGHYFKIYPYESINSFVDSKIWRCCNFKFKVFAKIDYKSCFDSIYTHAFTWIIERNIVDAKNANNANLFITIDRVFQNINGHSSNGIPVGPEFSRMMAEILLQHIDKAIVSSLDKENIHCDRDYKAFRYVDDIYIFAQHHEILEKIINTYKLIGEKYLLRLNELKISKGNTPCLPKEWLEKARHLADIIGHIFFKGRKEDFAQLPDTDRFLVKSEYIPLDRIKDEITVLVKTHSVERRTIVSFLLSTLLNNIGKKKNGYKLLGPKSLGTAITILDLTFFIYAYHPSFDQTRKIISIISYINSEINFLSNDKSLRELSRLIHSYDFIFNSGNLPDLCDWLPMLREYNIKLAQITENQLLEKVIKLNNPIIWANFLIYAKYSKSYFQEVKTILQNEIERHLEKISSDDPMMFDEFWFVLIFYNCPYLESSTSSKINSVIDSIAPTPTDSSPASVAKQLLYDFLTSSSSNNSPTKDGLFNWGMCKNFSNLVTYRTFQRTLFKQYNKKHLSIYSSLD